MLRAGGRVHAKGAKIFCVPGVCQLWLEPEGFWIFTGFYEPRKERKAVLRTGA
jgi:hypothetical protein